jgi:NAD(P)-dependent dehydrogenase (short-subunit alcohol dehydrogenase family)
MKVVITGHTHGIGKALYDNFQTYRGWEVVGLSRSNGHDIDKDFDRVVEAATGCFLFINNAYRDKQQTKLVQALKDKVTKMIVMGSVSRQYPELIHTDYVHDKQELSEACRLISIDPKGIDVLHLDLSFIEGMPDDADPTHFVSDYNLKFEEIVSAVNFWMTNPKIRQIEFRWKLTPFVYSQLRQAFPTLDPSRITF